MPQSGTLDCYAVAQPGLEQLVARELSGIGIVPDVVELGGVSFPADRGLLARANLELRTASRVLVRLGTFHASAFHELERRALRLPWDRYLAPGGAVAFRVTARKSKLYHQDAVAQRLGAVVARRVPGATLAAGAAGDPADATDGMDPVQSFVIRLFRDECTVSADASGANLYRRGYRLATAKAPLRETLAAAMLLALGWDGAVPLMDPFCGSGTIPIEAALIARRMAPGLSRRFACERWPALETIDWAGLRTAARSRVLPRAPVPILASDRDAGAIEAARENARRAGVLEDIEVRRAAVSAMAPPAQCGAIVTNPPYGVRVGRGGDLRDLYAQLGNVLRRRCGGWRIGLLSARDQLAAQIGLELHTVLRTSTGGIRVSLLEGSVPVSA